RRARREGSPMRRGRVMGLSGVLVVLALALAPMAPPARAVTTVPDKVDPALRVLMQARPTALLPVIVEMQPPAAPFTAASSANRAHEALELLRLNGTAAVALALIHSAAGFAHATGIESAKLVATTP